MSSLARPPLCNDPEDPDRCLKPTRGLDTSTQRREHRPQLMSPPRIPFSSIPKDLELGFPPAAVSWFQTNETASQSGEPLPAPQLSNRSIPSQERPSRSVPQYRGKSSPPSLRVNPWRVSNRPEMPFPIPIFCIDMGFSLRDRPELRYIGQYAGFPVFQPSLHRSHPRSNPIERPRCPTVCYPLSLHCSSVQP